MSKAMTAPGWNDLPMELKLQIMHEMPDVSSLLNITRVDPSVHQEIGSSSSFKTILPAVLARSVPREIQILILMFLNTREAGKFPNDKLASLVRANLEFDQEREILLWHMNVKHPMTALRSVVQIQKAVKYFTQTFARCVCQPPGIYGQSDHTDPQALSKTEAHRIRRSQWRYEICCQLSASWMPSGDIDLAKDDFGDGRVSRQTIFLSQFVPWKIEEIHCIHDHLKSLLERNSQDPCRDHWGNWVNIYKLPTSQPHSLAPGQPLPGVKAKILSQGLAFLHTFLREASPRTRESLVKGLHFPCDEFFIPAIRVLKKGCERFSKYSEALVASNTCPWADNHGANTANLGWGYFSEESYRDGLYSFAYIRQFGFCIWDDQRLIDWVVLNGFYGAAVRDKLMAIQFPGISEDQRDRRCGDADRLRNDILDLPF